MSASIDSQRFSAYSGGCPNMNCPGKSFPVEEIYLPSQVSTVGDQLVSHASDVLFENIVSKGVQGDVLSFFSGAADIDACVSKINSRAKKDGDNVVAYPLYARLDEASRDAAADPYHRWGLQDKAREGTKHKEMRKVICTTNVRNICLLFFGCFDSGYRV
jgi:HrpA-like RNA helicase